MKHGRHACGRKMEHQQQQSALVHARGAPIARACVRASRYGGPLTAGARARGSKGRLLAMPIARPPC